MAFYDFARIVCSLALRIAFNIKVEGKEKIPTDGGIILCCNHRTNLDPVLLGMPLKRHIKFMAKEELFRGFGGAIIKRLGAFPVSRGDHDGKALATAISTVENGNALVIFPEGTRSKTGELLKFKSGIIVVAAQTGGDIIPCCVKYDGKLKFRSKIHICYGDLIKRSELELDNLTPAVRKKANEFLRNKVEELILR